MAEYELMKRTKAIQLAVISFLLLLPVPSAAKESLDLSLNGNPAEALPHLHWVRENGNKNFVEYPLALAEIERIEAAVTRRQINCLAIRTAI